MPVVLDCVVSGHLAAMLEAQYACQVQVRIWRAICVGGLCWWHPEALVEAGSRKPTGLGWPLRWFWPQPDVVRSPADPGRCRWPVLPDPSPPENARLLHPKLCHRTTELGRRRRLMPARYILEDGVAVTVQGQRNPTTPDQLLHEEEIAMSVLFMAKQCVGHGLVASSIANSRVHRGPRSSSGMNAAIYLHQHAFLAHALATDPISGGRRRRGLAMPAPTRIRRTVERPKTISSRSARSSVRCV